MKNLAALLLLPLLAVSVGASPQDESEEPANVGLAMLVLADEANSVTRESRVYRYIIGGMQKEMRKADLFVFNAVLPPEKQPDWSQGLEAVNHSVSTLDNPHLDTVVIVNATVTETTGEQATTELQLRLFDVESGVVYGKLQTEANISIAESCDDTCIEKKVNRQLVKLGEKLLPEVLGSIRSEYAVGEATVTLTSR